MRVAIRWLLSALVLSAAPVGCTGEEPKLTLGAQCDLSSQCDLPLVCRLARCRTECATTRDCPIGQLCVPDQAGIGACLLPDEATCTLDSECPEPLVCLGGGCTNECTIDRDCALGATCERDSAGRRYCREVAAQRCVLDSECTEVPGEVCGVDGVCRAACRADRDCREGLLCSGGACTLPDGGVGDGGVAADGSVEPDGGATTMDGGSALDGATGDAAMADGGVPVSCTTAADCSAPGVVTATCDAGECQVDTCQAGLDDCNGAFVDGCEARLAVDPLHCGACGTSCGAYGRCSDASCDGIEGVGIGENHACFLRGNGLVLCMGQDSYGQLGRGVRGLSYYPDPYPVPWITDAVAVEAGVYISCVMHAGGTASCFGVNGGGQLADGTFTNRASPTPVMGVPAMAQISPSLAATCAITTAGELWCWGAGSCGQNGLGDGLSYNRPQRVTTVTDPAQVDTSQTHTCVVRESGSVACFGKNRDGALGDGVTNHGFTCNGLDASLSPVTVSGITDAIHVEVGYYSSCAVHAGGGVSCWGRNYGGLGAAATATGYDTPQPVPGIDTAVQVSVGSRTACARLSDGRVLCWGQETLGAGPSPSLTEPNEAVGITDAVDVEVGLAKACAVLSTGRVTCWGYNDAEFGPDHLWENLETPADLPTIRP